jgi:hypothetical protein
LQIDFARNKYLFNEKFKNAQIVSIMIAITVFFVVAFLLQGDAENLALGKFKVESPTGEPVVGMALSIFPGGKDVLTDDTGIAEISVVKSSFFVVRGRKELYQTLYIFGKSSEADMFNYTSFMGSRAEARALSRLVGIPFDPSLGTVVIGLDKLVDPEKGLAPSNLSPAVGSSAVLKGVGAAEGAEYSEPFVFAPRLTNGTTVLPHASSFITYLNRVPTTTSTSTGPSAMAIAPAGQKCLFSPGMGSQEPELQPVEVYADAVSVVSFICE